MAQLDYQIRPIEQQDVEQVYRLLLDLAQHEKIADRLVVTPDKMKIELFDSIVDWHSEVVVIPNGTIIGFCLYSFANTNRAFNRTPLLNIDDIYVHPEYRTLGIGQKLLQSLSKIAKDKNIERIELWCIKKNMLGQLFYQRNGARKLDVDVYQLSVQSLLE